MSKGRDVLTVRDLSKTYVRGTQRVDALRGVSLTVNASAFTAIVGPSGSGKSTLLNLMGLLDTPDGGTIHLSGTDTAHLTPREAAAIRRTRIGFVFQSFNLIPVLNVRENIELPLHAGGGRAARAAGQREWVDHLVDAVGLADRSGHRPGELSGGQQQRVAIARALVNRPSIILADEPTANLDSETAHRILALMAEFSRTLETAFVFSTHDPDVRALASETLILHDGAVAAE